jgi:hypothetical protein
VLIGFLFAEGVKQRMLEFVPTSFTAILVDEFAALVGESAEGAAKCMFSDF